MKKTTILFLFMMSTLACFAQWVSPGDGNTYTMHSLSVAEPAVVSALANNQYVLLQDITISNNDTLLLEANVQAIQVADSVTIQISGTIIVQNRDVILPISGDTTGTRFYELRISQASATTLSSICFENCYRVMVMETDMTFTGCEFRNCMSAGINFMNCNPTIRNCYFHHNRAAAITSGANVTGSPKIINNIFYNNALDNGNVPQINLGPGAADTIIIAGNRIEGVASNMSGGVGIMNVYGIGNTRLLLRDNTIIHNRYGYTQNGSHISALLLDNIIQDNNLETNPNNGGSGVSIYGSDTTCAAKLRRNLISGNLWGVTAIYYHNLDMGTADDPGGNVLYNNGNGGTEYELYNNAFSNMSAIGNYWGNNDSVHAEAVIFHQADAPSYGLVTYNPIMMLEPKVLGFGILQQNNPQLNDDLFGYFNDQGDTIIFVVGCLIPGDIFSPLVPSITLPLGVSCTPDPTLPQVFMEPVTYTLTTPHGTTRTLTALIRVFGGVADNRLPSVSIYPNPCTDRLYIRNEAAEELQVDVFTAVGQQIGHFQTGQAETILHTADWAKGVYLLRIRQSDRMKTFKILVQ
ncbi:MAG: T9SS type A sorting domain-containing protein [Bacteroidales bacterium]|nr:T9SS type A sorting domain-containing protein [Bacteroidales bacterium]MBR6160543.1 T9SS type A sorting domain-containing protein [Bacteroidales bacterium]